MREKDPYVTSRKIAEAIHGDPAITSPSYEQISDTIPRWERDGDLPRRVTRAK